jgi:hypothetical protein
MRVLSFDCGLRNLGVALVELRPGYVLPPECKVFASPSETVDEFKERALQHFLLNGWLVSRATLEDVSKELDREKPVKKILNLGPVAKASALTRSLERLESGWFVDGQTADYVAVEVQHNANAEMRAVSMAIHVFFMRSMVDSKFLAVQGGKKLLLCDALGITRGMGAGVQKKKRTLKPVVAAAAAAAVDQPEDEPGSESAKVSAYFKGNSRASKWAARSADKTKTSSGLTKKEQYRDNKERAPMALRHITQHWRGDGPAGFLNVTLVELMRDPNVADAVLQGVWVLWSELVQPRAPVKSRKRKADVE